VTVKKKRLGEEKRGRGKVGGVQRGVEKGWWTPANGEEKKASDANAVWGEKKRTRRGRSEIRKQVEGGSGEERMTQAGRQKSPIANSEDRSKKKEKKPAQKKKNCVKADREKRPKYSKPGSWRAKLPALEEGVENRRTGKGST